MSNVTFNTVELLLNCDCNSVLLYFLRYVTPAAVARFCVGEILPLFAFSPFPSFHYPPESGPRNLARGSAEAV